MIALGLQFHLRAIHGRIFYHSLIPKKGCVIWARDSYKSRNLPRGWLKSSIFGLFSGGKIGCIFLFPVNKVDAFPVFYISARHTDSLWLNANTFCTFLAFLQNFLHICERCIALCPFTDYLAQQVNKCKKIIWNISWKTLLIHAIDEVFIDSSFVHLWCRPIGRCCFGARGPQRPIGRRHRWTKLQCGSSHWPIWKQKVPKGHLEVSGWVHRRLVCIFFSKVCKKRGQNTIPFKINHPVHNIRMYWPNFRLTTVREQQSKFVRTIIEVYSSHLHPSFGTFCVQIGQLFETQ